MLPHTLRVHWHTNVSLYRFKNLPFYSQLNAKHFHHSPDVEQTTKPSSTNSSWRYDPLDCIHHRWAQPPISIHVPHPGILREPSFNQIQFTSMATHPSLNFLFFLFYTRNISILVSWGTFGSFNLFLPRSWHLAKDDSPPPSVRGYILEYQ